MAAAVAQSAVGQTSNGTSVTTSGSPLTTAGSGRTFLIVASDATNMATPTDSKGNTYTACGSGNNNAGNLIRAWVCVNGTGGSNHYASATLSAAGYPVLIFLEISGALTSGAHDTAAYNQGGDDFSPYTITTTGASLAQADNLCISAFTHNVSGTTEAAVASPSTLVAQQADAGLYWTLAVGAGNTSSTSPFTASWTRTGANQTGLLMIVIKSAAGGSIVEADATITGSSTDAYEGQKLLGGDAAAPGQSDDAYLGSIVLTGEAAQTGASTEAWVGTGVASGDATLSTSSTDVFVSGSILAAVWAAVGDAVCAFDSNAVATGEADMVVIGEAAVSFIVTAVGAGEGGFALTSADQYIGAATVAADMVSADTGSTDAFLASLVLNATAALVADAIVAWETGTIPGDGGATTVTSILRRMRRDGQRRVMTSARPARKMTR